MNQNTRLLGASCDDEEKVNLEQRNQSRLAKLSQQTAALQHCYTGNMP